MAVCLVTRGAGLIGSHLVEALLPDEHVVRVLDNFSTGSQENLENARTQIELINADVTDQPALRAVEVVFHQVAGGTDGAG
jgi:nucleoside-diphosphate-sugar epimerase